jgi:transposase
MAAKSRISIAQAARVLDIKVSTAKLIVKRYRTEGTFFERKHSKETRSEKRENI